MSLIPFAGAVQKFNRQRGGYQIERSLRFNSADSAYLTRTPATASGYDQWTFSCWFKIVNPADTVHLIGGNTTTSGGTRNELVVKIGSSQLSVWAFNNSSGYYFDRFSSALYRDPSAWYHLVLQFDPDNGTSANKIIAYINGVQVTWGSSADSGSAGNIGSSAYRSINNTYRNDIGGGYQGGGAPIYFSNAYMTEMYMVSGSLVAQTDFGEFNSTTGVWQPKAYTGSYGTNGFYLNFSDNASTTTLGDDLSGNGNDWSTSGFSVTAGKDNDSLVDTPTNYGTDTGVGGEVRGNYCTLNPLNSATADTYSQGNLKWVKVANTTNTVAVSTIAVSSGKWYWEGTVANTGGSNIVIGIADSTTNFLSADTNLGMTGSTTSYAYNGTGPYKQNNNTQTSYGATFTTNDVIGVAFDADAGTITFYKNGVSQGTAFTGITGTFTPAVGGRFTNDSWWLNFGQRPFAYTAPSGFKALCTQNLPEPTIVDGGEYFNTVLYTGNGSTQSITGVGFQPDWVWAKSRTSGSDNHILSDAVRGATKQLISNLTDAEYSVTNLITAFNSDGFSLGNNAQLNTNTDSYVAWNWKANGAGVTNNDGTITSTVSANTDSGFSIATFTKTDSTNQTIGHGLGVAPSMIIVKTRQSSGYTGWAVYHTSTGSNGYLELNTTSAFNTFSTTWNNTAPTSTVFTMGTGWTATQDMVAYCFAAIPGYSAFGSFVGNGSTDGPFIFCGFRPRWILIKASSAVTNWWIWDTARNTYNVMNAVLYPDLSNAEYSDASTFLLDTLSNGFKYRTSNSTVNGSGTTYIYAAFAENPFKYSLAR